MTLSGGLAATIFCSGRHLPRASFHSITRSSSGRVMCMGLRASTAGASSLCSHLSLATRSWQGEEWCVRRARKTTHARSFPKVLLFVREPAAATFFTQASYLLASACHTAASSSAHSLAACMIVQRKMSARNRTEEERKRERQRDGQGRSSVQRVYLGGAGTGEGHGGRERERGRGGGERCWTGETPSLMEGERDVGAAVRAATSRWSPRRLPRCTGQCPGNGQRREERVSVSVSSP